MNEGYNMRSQSKSYTNKRKEGNTNSYISCFNEMDLDKVQTVMNNEVLIKTKTLLSRYLCQI